MKLKNYIHWTKNGSNFVTVDGINKKTTKKCQKVKESETTFLYAKQFKYKIKTIRGLHKNETKKLHPLDKKWVKFCYC